MTFRPLAFGLLVAALLATGCAATPAPAATTPAASASAAPTPSPETPQAKVPFAGECADALTADTVAEIFEGATPTGGASSFIGRVVPDAAGSLAQLGGLDCTWSSTGSDIAYLAVSVIPAAAVPAEVVADHEEFDCYGWGMCGRAEVASGMWVFAETPRLDPMLEALTAEESQRLTRVVDAAISSVVNHAPVDYTGVPTARGTDWWPLPPCDALQTAVATAAGMTSPETGFPGDNVPEGAVWETLKASGVMQWCPWYQNVGQETLLSELYLQSGVGAPSPSQLAAAGAEQFSLEGADAAYRLIQHNGVGTPGIQVLAVVGPNRLLVGGDNQEAVAAAVVAALAA
jgi:hypothetical protein